MARDRLVMESVRSMGIPFVLTSGGGYSRPGELSAEAHANTYRTAWQVFVEKRTANVGSFAAGERLPQDNCD